MFPLNLEWEGAFWETEMKTSLPLKPSLASKGGKQIFILNKICARAELYKHWGSPQALGGPGVLLSVFSGPREGPGTQSMFVY